MAAPVRITIRFTTSIPDLHLSLANSKETSAVALKHLIRTNLEPPTSTRRLRLIHAGKLFKDDDVLASVLKIPSAPPQKQAAADHKGKGKAVDIATVPLVYINCSIGDELTAAELADEERAAKNAAVNKKKKKDDKDDEGRKNGLPSHLTTTTPTPRGFDRLLSGGFTPAEVNQLRLQFLSIQSNIHTPDTMPSPSTLRSMEDAWIDDNAGPAGASGGDGQFDFGDDGIGGGALDDLLWGNVMGFLWPLGCVGWMVREEGVWSQRRKIAVVTGFLLSLTFGLLRAIS